MNWKSFFKWLGGGVAAILGLAVLVAAFQLWGFNRGANRVLDVEPLAIEASTDSAIIARGRHLAESIGGCLGCHGENLRGTPGESFGPIGVMGGPNLTTGVGGVGGNYTDGELARAVKYGIGADGRTLLFMSTPEHYWWPESDIVAVVSFVRSLPPQDNEGAAASVGLLGKLLTQFGVMELRSAMMIDRDAAPESVPDPEPTAQYGQFIARGCMGCHGDGLSGGAIPGAPAELAIPANLTFHETGLGGWTQEDFITALNTGVRPDGRVLDSFMPISSTRAMNDVEKAALWAYLESMVPVELGNR